MKTIPQTYIDQGYELGLEQARQEMQQEIQKAYQEAQAEKRLGLLSSIELGLELKFGKEGLGLFNEVKQIHRHACVARNELAHHNSCGAQVCQRFRGVAEHLPAATCE